MQLRLLICRVLLYKTVKRRPDSLERKRLLRAIRVQYVILKPVFVEIFSREKKNKKNLVTAFENATA